MLRGSASPSETSPVLTAPLAIYLGHQLFVSGASGRFKFGAVANGDTVGFASSAADILVAGFGMVLAGVDRRATHTGAIAKCLKDHWRQTF